MAEAPKGFVYLPPLTPGDFGDMVGPWFLKDEDGKLVGGFRVMAHHLNPNRVCHGGMLAAFLDVYLALAAGYASDVPHMLLPTVNLSLDFLEPTPAGAWVEARAELLRMGRRLAIVQGLVRAEGRLTVRANGTFSVPSADNPKGAARRDAMRQHLRSAAV